MTPAEESTVALYLPGDPHFWHFLPQAAPGKSSGFSANRLGQLRSRLERFLREHPGHALDSWPLPAD
jgi:hypothetical protein